MKIRKVIKKLFKTQKQMRSEIVVVYYERDTGQYVYVKNEHAPFDYYVSIYRGEKDDDYPYSELWEVEDNIGGRRTIRRSFIYYEEDVKANRLESIRDADCKLFGYILKRPICCIIPPYKFDEILKGMGKL